MRPRANEKLMTTLADKNRRTLQTVLGVAALMIALSFAFVPAYRLLCQVTGWGGTTKTAAVNPSQVFAREFTVKFNADTDPSLPWRFTPDQHDVTIKVGASALISYTAENRSNAAIVGMAIHNVTPLKVGKYFNKTQCFCFGEQTLGAWQKVHMPVTFFIDPKIMDDRELKDLKTITLSYTFYKQNSPALEKAQKKFYD
jgi:cytochrome c oxidase assembly protein subunit 11